MGKDFLKYDAKRLSILIVVGGMIITAVMGILSIQNSSFQEAYELERPKREMGTLEREVVVEMNGEKFPVNVAVEERQLTEEEADKLLLEAEQLLHKIVLGQNESEQEIFSDICFPEVVPETGVEVDWILKPLEFVEADGTLRDDVEISEKVSQKLSAVLSCQEYTKDYEAVITFVPKKRSVQKNLEVLIQQAEKNSREQDIFKFPTDYEGSTLRWKNPMDFTFLYFFILTIAAAVFLQMGGKRDLHMEKVKKRENLEREYAQIVSKFSMLLSAGLSIRNAWARILMMEQGKSKEPAVIYEEMAWAYRQMQKGVSELEVYEKFGVRVGVVSYKKLMALFISDRRKGSRNLIEVMNEEMLQAWEEQKRRTKQQGEQIGTKLLLPMMGMLSVVFVMILVPAFLSFG